jgi:SAM-dependent methyltransferase
VSRLTGVQRRFPVQHFDLCISRFGTMFFADPIAAFTNIGTALRPEARLVIMVWQAPNRDEWWTTIRQALAAGSTAPVPPGSGPHIFSLADPDSIEGILAASGFAEVGCTEVHEPVCYGLDAADAHYAGARHAGRRVRGAL